MHCSIVDRQFLPQQRYWASGTHRTQIVRRLWAIEASEAMTKGGLLVRRRHSQRSFLNRTYKPRQIDRITPTTIG